MSLASWNIVLHMRSVPKWRGTWTIYRRLHQSRSLHGTWNHFSSRSMTVNWSRKKSRVMLVTERSQRKSRVWECTWQDEGQRVGWQQNIARAEWMPRWRVAIGNDERGNTHFELYRLPKLKVPPDPSSSPLIAGDFAWKKTVEIQDPPSVWITKPNLTSIQLEKGEWKKKRIKMGEEK